MHPIFWNYYFLFIFKFFCIKIVRDFSLVFIGFCWLFWFFMGEYFTSGGQRERKKTKKARLVLRSGGTYVNQFSVVTLSQIVQDARRIEHSHVGHIFDFFEFRRVRFFNQIGFKILCLLFFS